MRRAIAQALDREALLAGLLPAARPTNVLLPPELPGAATPEEAARLPHFDRERAREELRGVPGLDRPLRLVFRAGDSFVPEVAIAERIAAQLAAGGHHGDAGCALGLLRRGGSAHAARAPRAYDMYMRRLGADYAHPNTFFTLFEREGNHQTGWETQSGGEPMARFERLLEEADAEADAASRARRCTPQAQAVLLGRAGRHRPAVPPGSLLTGSRAKLRGLDVDPFNFLALQSLRLAPGRRRRAPVMRQLLVRLGRQLVLVPIVALASYFLMASLPLTTEDDTKRQVSPELAASYRRDLGLGEPLGFLRPWQKLFRGERLGTSAQGVTGDELLLKLSGSVGVGLGGAGARARLGAGLRAPQEPLAAGTLAVLRGRHSGGGLRDARLHPRAAARSRRGGAGAPAPRADRRARHLCLARRLPRHAAGGCAGDRAGPGLRAHRRQQGPAPGRVLRRHVLPNVLPALLDAVGPVATALLAGSFAAERVFGLPYFGQLYVLAVLQKQVAVVVVATTVFASVLVAVGLAVELVRLLVDPRAREDRT